MATLTSNLVISLTDRLTGRLGKLSAGLQRFQARQQAIAASVIPGGSIRSLVGAYLGYQTLSRTIGGTVGAAMKFETAMSDVKKVVDTTPAGFEQLRNEILAMSRRIPVATEGLAGIMAAAGQASIATQDLTRFTELTAKASVAFGMTAGEVGQSFAELKEVYGLNLAGLQDLADGANYLSNRFATTASKILDFTNRAAGAAKTLNMSLAEMQAVGAGMTASGIVPETAARGINAMATRLAVGGPKISRAFKTMGWSFKEWRKLRDENSPAAMIKMFELVSKLDKDKAAGVWKDLVGQDFADDFSKLRPDILARAFADMADQTARAGSVAAEYAVRAKTTENALQLLQNSLRAIGIDIGSKFLPQIAEAFTRLANDVNRLQNSTDSVFAKFSAAWSGFFSGLLPESGRFVDAVKAQFASLETFIFGSGITPDTAGMEYFESLAGSNIGALSRIGDQFKELGAAIRGLLTGDISQIQNLGSALFDLVSSFGAITPAAVAGGVAAIGAISRVLMALGVALVMSRVGQIGIAAAAITEIVEAVKSAEGIGDGFGKLMEAFGDKSVLEKLGWVAAGLSGMFYGRKSLAGRAVGGAAGGLFKGLGRLLGFGSAGSGAAAGAAEAAAGSGASGSSSGGGAAAGGSGIRGRAGFGLFGGALMMLGDLFSTPEEQLAQIQRNAERWKEVGRLADGTWFGRTWNSLSGRDQQEAEPASGEGAPSSSSAPAGPTAERERHNAALERALDLTRQLEAARAAGAGRPEMKGIATDRSAALAELPEGADTFIGQYQAALREAGGQLSAEASRIADEARSAFSSAMTGGEGTSDLGGNAMVDSFGQTMSGAVSIALSTAGQIVSAFASLSQQLFSSGANAALQLAAGIRSQTAAVSAAATALAQTVAAKFPQSPAREGPLRQLPYMGAEIVRQLAGGMRATGPASAAAMGLAAAIASGVPQTAMAGLLDVQGAPMVAGAPGASGAAPGAPVNVYVTIGAPTISVSGAGDPRGVGESVARQLGESVALAIRANFGDVLL